MESGGGKMRLFITFSLKMKDGGVALRLSMQFGTKTGSSTTKNTPVPVPSHQYIHPIKSTHVQVKLDPFLQFSFYHSIIYNALLILFR